MWPSSVEQISVRVGCILLAGRPRRKREASSALLKTFRVKDCPVRGCISISKCPGYRILSIP